MEALTRFACLRSSLLRKPSPFGGARGLFLLKQRMDKTSDAALKNCVDHGHWQFSLNSRFSKAFLGCPWIAI